MLCLPCHSNIPQRMLFITNITYIKYSHRVISRKPQSQTEGPLLPLELRPQAVECKEVSGVFSRQVLYIGISHLVNPVAPMT